MDNNPATKWDRRIYALSKQGLQRLSPHWKNTLMISGGFAAVIIGGSFVFGREIILGFAIWFMFSACALFYFSIREAEVRFTIPEFDIEPGREFSGIKWDTKWIPVIIDIFSPTAKIKEFQFEVVFRDDLRSAVIFHAFLIDGAFGFNATPFNQLSQCALIGIDPERNRETIFKSDIQAQMACNKWNIEIAEIKRGGRARVLLAIWGMQPFVKPTTVNPSQEISIRGDYKAPWGKHHPIRLEFTRPSPALDMGAPPNAVT